MKKGSSLSASEASILSHHISKKRKCQHNPKTPVQQNLDDITSPIEYVLTAFSTGAVKSTESPLFQHRPSDDDVAGYSLELVMALRDGNLAKIQEFHAANARSLARCNRFGESLLHMACRRGYTDICRFMVQDAGVSLWVHDDFGRTPMHYSCWTPEPNLELLDLLVTMEPTLLLMSDVRGHMPMHYVREEDWSRWIDFLKARTHLLVNNKQAPTTTTTTLATTNENP